MARESRDIWKKRVERWVDSGLSAREFAAEIGVNVHTLTHWKWQLGQQTGRPEAAQVPRAPPSFVEVVAPLAGAALSPTAAAPAAFELEFARGIRLRVPANFEAAALRRLVDVLESR